MVFKHKARLTWFCDLQSNFTPTQGRLPHSTLPVLNFEVNKMTATTNSTFNGATESLDVAAAYADSIRGNTVVITGVNQGGIGFSTAEAFVSNDRFFSEVRSQADNVNSPLSRQLSSSSPDVTSPRSRRVSTHSRQSILAWHIVLSSSTFPAKRALERRPPSSSHGPMSQPFTSWSTTQGS